MQRTDLTSAELKAEIQKTKKNGENLKADIQKIWFCIVQCNILQHIF